MNLALNQIVLKNLSEAMLGDSYYQSKITYWNRLKIAFNGGSDYTFFILKKNPLESDANYAKRLANAYYFNYPSTIIGLYSFSIMEQEAKSSYGSIALDEIWMMFNSNCDQFNTNLKDFIDRTQIYASIYGHVGVLVNKPILPEKSTRADEIRNGLIPYLTMYTPDRILSALFERNPVTHKIELSFLKLHDLDDRIQVWTKTNVRIYQLNKTNPEIKPTDVDSISIIFDGPNPFDNEIPFIFQKNLYNPSTLRDGLSDIREIEPIAASIITNCSIAEEIFENAGFPMMRKPMLQDGQSDPDEAGPTAILEFDPQFGEAAKPDWLKPEVLEPITAIINWIEKKVDEIYRLAYLSGMHQQAKGSQVRSGAALRYELKQLTSILTQKTKALTELELEIIRMFLKWQNQLEKLKEVSVTRPVDFVIDELMDNFDMMVKSLDSISSDEYNMQIQKRIVQLMLPGAPKDIIEIINKEITSTKNLLLQKAMADTVNAQFGRIHVEAENAQKLAEINAISIAEAAASKQKMEGVVDNVKIGKNDAIKKK